MAAEQTVRIDGPISTTGTTTVSNTVKTQPYANVTSLHASGFASSVTAGQAICTLTAPPAGFYEVEINRIAGGSGTPTLYNNGQFKVGATSYVLPSTPTLDLPYKFTFYVGVDGSTNLSVNAVSNGAANITITASITATRMA